MRRLVTHLFLVCTILMPSFSFGKDTDLSYAQIGESYIKSFGLVESNGKNEKSDFSKGIALSDQQMRATVFALFDCTEKEKMHQTFSPMETVAHDLNLFYFQSKEEQLRSHHLFSKIDYTQTVFGQAVLAKKLASPCADINQLRKNQDFVKCLVEDEKLFKSLDKAVQDVREHQEALLYFWQDIGTIEQEQIDALFFKSYLPEKVRNLMNRSPLFMEVVTRFNNAWPLLWFMVDKMVFTVADRFFGQSTDLLQGTKEVLCDLVLRDYNPFEIREEYSQYCLKKVNQSLKPGIVDFIFSDNDRSILIPWRFLVKIPLAIMFTRTQINVTSKITYIHDKLMGAGAVVQAADQINTILAKHKNLYPALSYAKDVAEKNISVSGKKLFDLLRTNTFKGEASFFSLSGRVKAAYSLMQEVKNELAAYMKFIGQIDAYLSIAKLYKEQSTKNHYCFVDYEEQATPHIKLCGFWNPMLDPQKAVGNSIEFGTSKTSRGALVTGSNSAGKSTIMITGLASTLLLAQVLGIAPADEMSITPFAYIGTSLKIQDNVATGQSHFVAETKHASRIANTIKQLPSGAKAFLVVDELFEGTTAQVGSKALYDFGKKLATNDNLIFVICTQYQSEPTMLEHDTNGVCKNYRVDAIKNEDGTITRPYKVELGVSQVSIGQNLLDDAFDDE